MILRSAGAGDNDFLFQVFAAAGPARELHLLPDSPLRDQLIQMQFQSWRTGYTTQFGNGLRIIESEPGVPAGYIWLYDDPREHRIVDFAFAPEFRSRGLGSLLIAELAALARAASKPMRASIAKSNPGSLRFCLRSGAVMTTESPTHWDVEWPIASPGGEPRWNGEPPR